MPRAVALDLVPIGTTDDLDALLTVELDQHLVTAVMVPIDGNWRRIASLVYATPFDNGTVTPTTWLRTARSMVQKDRYRAVFHASTGSLTGNYTENEAHLRIVNGKPIISISFESTARAMHRHPTSPALHRQARLRHHPALVPARPRRPPQKVRAGHRHWPHLSERRAEPTRQLSHHAALTTPQLFLPAFPLLRNHPALRALRAQRSVPQQVARDSFLMRLIRPLFASNALMRLSVLPFLVFAFTAAAQQTPHTLTYAPGKSITLSLPAELDIAVAATGIKRPRFFAQSPDGRIFVTSMVNLADNTNGAVYILDGWNAETHSFAHVIPYLQHLRNTNNIAFYTDDAHQSWLYLPLTDRLVRYKYNPGDKAPKTPPELLIRFPDYGLNYKYGGWHLTRTVAVATLHSATRIYITTGSSCNYCREREAVRASLIVMDPDGSHQQILAHGLRNAVDLQYIPNLDRGSLFATNMGDDHLGERLPEDTFFELDSNRRPGPITAATAPNYGWPTCYFGNGYPIHDVTPLPSDHGPKDKIIAPKTRRRPHKKPRQRHQKSRTSTSRHRLRLRHPNRCSRCWHQPRRTGSRRQRPRGLRSRPRATLILQERPAGLHHLRRALLAAGLRLLRIDQLHPQKLFPRRPARRQQAEHRHGLSRRPLHEPRPQTRGLHYRFPHPRR